METAECKDWRGQDGESPLPNRTGFERLFDDLRNNRVIDELFAHGNEEEENLSSEEEGAEDNKKPDAQVFSRCSRTRMLEQVFETSSLGLSATMGIGGDGIATRRSDSWIIR
jgi:hypothetical protein